MSTAQTFNPKSTRSETKTAAAPVSPKVSARAGDIHEVIRRRAYQLFEERGCVPGYDLDDWLRAEAEVLAQFGTAPGRA